VLFRLSDTPGAINTAGPSLGKHTKEVLNKYGISDDQIAELKTKGVV
jgi:formyl-CoA transferase